MHQQRYHTGGAASWTHCCLIVMALLVMPGVVQAQADSQAGKRAFGQCAVCHAVGPGASHRIGPQLNGVLERDAGSAAGYTYSDAFTAKVDEGLSWSESTLDAFLAGPMDMIPGTKMAYLGVQDETNRRDIIAYLATLGADGAEVGGDTPASTKQDTAGKAAAQVQPRPLASETEVPEHGVLHLGRLALPEEIQAWDIDIRPDGSGLPDGNGSVESGGEIYDAQCASCHGVFGEGEGRWPVLAGGDGSLEDERPEKTIGSYWPYLSTVYDYVRRAMPFGNARSLSDDDVYALTAYLLYLNDLVDDSFVLSKDNFESIAMPNVDNFFGDTRPDESWFQSTVEPCMTDCLEGQAKVTQRARVLDVTPDGEGEEGVEGLD